MKKIIIFILVCIFSFSGVNAINNKPSKYKLKVYKEAILSRVDIRDNFNNGEKILDKIELKLNNIRKNKDIKTLENLKTRTGNIVKRYENKKFLTTKEKKLLYISKNLYLRSYIELVNFGKIKL